MREPYMHLLNLNCRNHFIRTFFSHRMILIILILCMSKESNCQVHIYENFGVDDGLPSSEVYDVYQDKEGYIWFATDKGLSRYNGYEFENFDTSDGLIGNVVLRFYPQKNGQIWCYSYHKKSLFYFEEIFDGFTQYKFNDVLKKELAANSTVKSIYVDAENDVHIGGLHINGEIIIKNNGTVENKYKSKHYFSDQGIPKRIALKPSTDTHSSPFFFTELTTAPKDSNFLYSHNKFSRLGVKWLEENEIAIFMTRYCIEITSKDQNTITLKNDLFPAGMSIIDKDHFFVGYEFGGAKIVNRNGTIIQEYFHDKSVTGFLKDHEGGFWFTTLNSGIYYIKNPTITVLKSEQITSHHVNSLVKTNENELLIGYQNGVISKVSNNSLSLLSKPIKSTTNALVEFDPISNTAYKYSDLTIQVNQASDSILYEYILKLSEPYKNIVFAGSSYNFFEIRQNGPAVQHHFPSRTHDICLWNNDTIIANPSGLHKIQNGEVVSLIYQSELFGFRSDDIDVNYNTNTLYMATHGAGLAVHDGTSIYTITEEDGLNTNIINEVYIENDSTVWTCSNKGINRIIWGQNDIQISGVGKEDGLLSNEVEDIEIINDTVWVGTLHGLCNFPKEQMGARNIDLPYLKLNQVFINNTAQHSFDSPNLNYEENDIEFVLEGISYINNDNIKYLYRLNKSQSWSSTQHRNIRFSSLTPGNYTFEAKMCIDDSCSETVITYAFTIQEPFWRHWWFRFSCMFVIGLLIYSFFKIRVFTYNKDITRELIRLVVKKLKRNETYFTFRENGNDVRIKTEEIIYVKSAGNYIDVFTKNKTHTIRMNIGKFLDNVPDRLEYVRLHRSYIVRIDKITTKSKNEVQLANGVKIPVSLNWHKKLKDVVF